MGDRNYHPNQYNPFIAQNYGYNQYQRLPQQQTPEPQAHPGPYFPNVPSQRAGFTVNTNIPVYNTGAIAQNPGTHSTSSMDQDYKPPPSYEESRSDRLLSKSKFISSPAWNYSDVKVEMDQSPQKHSFARDLFDMPGETRPVKKSPDWSSDNYCSSQSFKRESQERFDYISSQSFKGESQERFDYSSSQSFKGESQERFDYNLSQSLKRESQERFDSPNRFSQPSDHAGQSNYRFSQNNQGGPSKNYQNRGRGRGRGGFRGRGHWQNNERQLNHEEHVDSKFDFEEQGQESDDEYGYGNEGTDEHPEKVNAFIPHPSIVSKYTYFPPSLEEMGEMFKDLVIYFFWKTPKNMKEKNPFVVICETFRRSAGYCNIDVEDGYDPRVKDRKFCTLRYNGMMMVRGVGENGCIKEARVRAGVSLINNLAMSCYTLKSKANYFSAEAFGQMQEIGSVPGIYILVPGQEAYDFESSRSYINRNLKEDSDVEYIFHFKNHKEALQFKGWARRQNLEFRFIKEGWYGVCRNRTTQYWRDKILASGTMESARYALLSPQGIGIEMFKNFDITSVVPKLKKVGPSRTPACIENLYGGPGEGPIINKARPPWERGNKGGKWKKTKTKKIMEQVQKGVPLHSVNAYKFLNKKKKKQLQKTLSRRLNINK